MTDSDLKMVPSQWGRGGGGGGGKGRGGGLSLNNINTEENIKNLLQCCRYQVVLTYCWNGSTESTNHISNKSLLSLAYETFIR